MVKGEKQTCEFRDQLVGSAAKDRACVSPTVYSVDKSEAEAAQSSP